MTMRCFTTRHLRAAAIVAMLACSARSARAQATPPSPAKPISDNSFLVEEAYNQEAGVVQHIGTYRRSRGGDWQLSFTQEWPAPGQRHQLSYTVPVSGALGQGGGMDDLALNYRYQLLGADDERVWMAPRLSALLPTGRVDRGHGAGGPGLQLNLPLSVSVSNALVTHWNAGATVSRARAASGARGTTRGVNAAASAIWLAAPTLNLMLETAWDRTESLGDTGARESEQSLVVLPGLRGAINLASGMQIVPGIGVPIGLGPSRGERGVFLYLSVEHSFR